MELEKNKAVIIKLKFENIKLRDRVMKVKQKQLQNNNVTKVINSSNNSSSNFNSITEQLSIEVYSKKLLKDILQITQNKKMNDCLLQQILILKILPTNIPNSVIA